MKTTIKITSCLVVLASSLMSTQAQVGIGVATPHSSSILDLTNTGNKGILLPKANTAPSGLTTPAEGLAIYYTNGLYLKESGGFNNLNAWKYKYGTAITEDVTFNPTSMVGVGIGINTGLVLGHLHVSATGKEVIATANSAALFIGNTTTGNHMIFDADEIMVKTSATAGGLLKLQEEDGSIQIGSDRVENTDAVTMYLNTTIGSTTNSKNLTVHGNVNAQSGKVQEKGYDLVPPGTIVAFFGATPKGWAPCDGQKYVLNASGVATVSATGAPTPNLGGRTIVGTGTGYTYDTPGGSATRVLTPANLPDHTHTGNTQSDGAHSHTGLRANLVDNDDNDDTFCAIGYSCGSDASGPQADGSVGSGGSNHVHALNPTGQTCAACTATAVDIRSPYHVLRYIMKL